jgi:exopolyphosphatase/guanosine-5'-triphosphate,3'-diphosphate pyrophosphatase
VEDPEAPLAPAAEATIRAHVTEQLRASGFDFGPAGWPLIATGGAFTVSRAVLAAQAGRDIRESSPHLTRNSLATLRQKLAAMPLHERLSVPHLPAARADILPTALVTIDALLESTGRQQLTHSFYNLRYGIAADLLIP